MPLVAILVAIENDVGGRMAGRAQRFTLESAADGR